MNKGSWVFAMLAASIFLYAQTALGGSRSGRVTMEFDLSAQEAGKEVKLWIPYPVSDADQLISELSFSGDYAASAVYTDRKESNPMLFARWDAGAQSRKLTLSFSVERMEVLQRDLPDKEPCWAPEDYREYLSATSLGPIDGEVKKLADKITSDKKTVHAKARAIYDWTCENMYRDPNTRGCGKGDVCALLQKPGGKCTDISSVFIALCRASGVPAREVFGLRLGKKPEEDITGYQHCWAEFFFPGYGWVVVDPADVRKAILVEDLKPGDKKIADHTAYFWGGLDPYRFALSMGRDVILNPPQAGEPLNTFGYPFAQVGDRTIDWLDPANFKYKFAFKEK
jgi:transglutaminase-like putative cysteine protease